MTKAKSTAPAKDTIYIDVEDEITAVIDKVVNAKRGIVALVLPKRASVFMSVVNMKLLKKAAKRADKNLVLITSDSSVLPIAATTGIHVAKTLTSRPEVPKTTELATKDEAVDLTDTEAAPDVTSDEESIEIDNTGRNAEGKPDAGKAKKIRRIMRIPDFSSFRLRAFLALTLVVSLIVLWFVGFVVMPTATVTINTDTSTITINAPVTLDVDATEADLDGRVLPATRVQVEKLDKLKVPATGQKNVGEKASGIMTLTNCINDGENKIVPAGTVFSRNNLNFVTTEAVTLPFAVFAGSTCMSDDFGRSRDVSVEAAQPGTEYNVQDGNFSSSISGIRAYGSDMTGGSSEIIKVVSAEDVKNAEEQLKGISKGAALGELKKQLEERDKLPLEATISEGAPTTINSPAVDAEAEEVEVTTTITYALLGIDSDDFSALLDNEVKKNVSESDKNIRDNGKEGAVIKLSNRPDEARTVITIETVATLGPDIHEAALRASIAGKRRGEIEKEIEAIDGVSSVSVEYSPGWVTTTPKSADKIRIVFNENNE